MVSNVIRVTNVIQNVIAGHKCNKDHFCIKPFVANVAFQLRRRGEKTGDTFAFTGYQKCNKSTYVRTVGHNSNKFCNRKKGQFEDL